MPASSLSTSILAHPDRVHRLPHLLRSLKPLRPSVVVDATTGEGNLSAALEAWAQHAAHGYHLVVQDDALPVPGFAQSAEAALRVADGAAVAFWMRPWHPDAHQHARCPPGSLISVRVDEHWPPTVALALPCEHITPLLDHAWRCHPTDVYDDDVIGCYLAMHHVPLLACSPSIVGHDSSERSILNHHQRRRRYRSADYLAVRAPSAWQLA